ncbi:hypothetical protein BK011_10430 [Tenericutes bacterium MZ-XQ]|nr:hypothetical protein BK011_10430 [Tenericutes bacterium MZ-XQ]
MKIVNRIIYGLIVAVGLMLVATITDEYFRSREVLAITEETLQNETYTDLISSAYFNDTPVYEETVTINNNEYLIIIYNAAHVTNTDSGLLAIEGFQFLMIQKSGTHLPEFFDVKVKSGDDIEVTYTGFNLYNQGLYAVFHPDTQGSLIMRREFIKDGMFIDIDQFVFEKDGEILLTLDINLTEEMLTVGSTLQTYLDENNIAPNADIDGVTYKEPLIIDVQNKVIRNVVIYLVLVIIGYILIFMRKKKTLGKDQATEGLKKDIERLKKDEKSDE